MSKDIKEDNKKEEKKNTDRIHITKTIIEGGNCWKNSKR